MTSGLLIALLIATILLQAYLPRLRILIVLSGAATATIISTLIGNASARELLSLVPWDVLVILVSLGMLSELFVAGRAFSVLAVWAARWSRGTAMGVLLVFGVTMFVISALMNNITALVLVLPVLIVLLRVVSPSATASRWIFGTVLVVCNLGGAASPIGDFPAILLLGRGAMTFNDYLVRALPLTLVALTLTLAVAAAVLARSTTHRDVLRPRLSRALISQLYRGARLDLRLILPASAILGAMLLAWAAGERLPFLSPEMVAWAGVLGALWLRPALGERLVRTRVDMEAVLFLLSLFVMVIAIRQTGLFSDLAGHLLALDLSPRSQLVVFILAAGLITGLFSAGPAMAALLEVAEVLAQVLPSATVYVGLALAVCAGSSLFLTAATAGPLAQALVERADLRSLDGQMVRLGFREFLPVGVAAFVIIEMVAVGYVLF